MKEEEHDSGIIFVRIAFSYGKHGYIAPSVLAYANPLNYKKHDHACGEGKLSRFLHIV